MVIKPFPKKLQNCDVSPYLFGNSSSHVLLKISCNSLFCVIECEIVLSISKNIMKIKPIHAYLDSTPRTLLFFFAVLVQLIASAISGSGFLLQNGTLMLIGFIVWILWFAMIFAIVMPGTDIRLGKKINQLKKGALIIFTSLLILGTTEAIAVAVLFPRLIQNQNLSSDFRQVLTGLKEVYEFNDGTALTQQATENLLAGKNPYAHANVVEAILKYNGIYNRVTPLQVGSFADSFPYPTDSELKQVWERAIQDPSQAPPEYESRVCYPAASFLLPAPFIFLGITDIRIVYAIFVLAGLAYAIWIIPARRRLLFIGAVLISLDLWNSIAGGETGSLCFPLMLVSWLALDRNLWVSAVFMGLSVSDKQTAWFFIPFFLILLFRQYGVKKLASALAIIAGIFAITNLPFAISDPGLWLTSIISPMSDPMFPIGGGLASLLTGGILHIQSSLPFTILEGAVFVVAIIWYWRNGMRYPQAGPLLAIVPLFFAWRSLWSYFFYVAIISLAYIMSRDDSYHSTSTAPLHNNPKNPKHVSS